MKFSALILLSFLPVAIAQNISVRLLVDIPEAMVPAVKAELDKSEDGIEKQIAEIAENRRALAGQDRIDTEMVKVEEVFATELPTPADPDHRALRGQNRELPSCTASLCDGYGGYAICRLYGICTRRRMRELVVLSEDEMEQLSEDELHTYSSNIVDCKQAINDVFGAIGTFEDKAREAIDAGTATASCFIS